MRDQVTTGIQSSDSRYESCSIVCQHLNDLFVNGRSSRDHGTSGSAVERTERVTCIHMRDSEKSTYRDEAQIAGGNRVRWD